MLQQIMAPGSTSGSRSPTRQWLLPPLLQREWAVTGLQRWQIRSQPAIRITTAALSTEDTEPLATDIPAALSPRGVTYSDQAHQGSGYPPCHG
jgi:hypothetical protein